MNTTPLPGMVECLRDNNWDTLEVLWNKFHPNSSITFTHSTMNEPVWSIREEFDERYLPGVYFALTRNKINKQRLTLSDPYKLLGLSLVSPLSRSVILTEGVSDFFTTKLLNPDLNVLGVTVLSGSFETLKVLANLFDDFTIVADNDRTGLSNANRFKSKLQPYGKVSIVTPDLPHKDITDMFMFNLKLCR